MHKYVPNCSPGYGQVKSKESSEPAPPPPIQAGGGGGRAKLCHMHVCGNRWQGAWAHKARLARSVNPICRLLKKGMALDILVLKTAPWASRAESEFWGEAAANRWARPQEGRRMSV